MEFRKAEGSDTLQRSRTTCGVIIFIFMLPVFYLLSYPVVLLLMESPFKLDPRTVAKIFRPVFYSAERYPTVKCATTFSLGLFGEYFEKLHRKATFVHRITRPEGVSNGPLHEVESSLPISSDDPVLKTIEWQDP